LCSYELSDISTQFEVIIHFFSLASNLSLIQISKLAV
jgi:hypothetical protein